MARTIVNVSIYKAGYSQASYLMTLFFYGKWNLLICIKRNLCHSFFIKVKLLTCTDGQINFVKVKLVMKTCTWQSKITVEKLVLENSSVTGLRTLFFVYLFERLSLPGHGSWHTWLVSRLKHTLRFQTSPSIFFVKIDITICIILTLFIRERMHR